MSGQDAFENSRLIGATEERARIIDVLRWLASLSTADVRGRAALLCAAEFIEEEQGRPR